MRLKVVFDLFQFFPTAITLIISYPSKERSWRKLYCIQFVNKEKVFHWKLKEHPSNRFRRMIEQARNKKRIKYIKLFLFSGSIRFISVLLKHPLFFTSPFYASACQSKYQNEANMSQVEGSARLCYERKLLASRNKIK